MTPVGEGQGGGSMAGANSAGIAPESPIVVHADPRKAWHTAQAECLLAGFSANLIDGDDGRPLLVVHRWSLCRSFTDVAEVRPWLARFKAQQTA